MTARAWRLRGSTELGFKGGPKQAQFVLPRQGLGTPALHLRAQSPVGKHVDAGGEPGRRAVSWSFKNLSASHIKLKCK